MTIYKLFDIRNLSYLQNRDGTHFYTDNYDLANEIRWKHLRNITPPNLLMEVITIHCFINGVFDGEILDIHLN